MVGRFDGFRFVAAGVELIAGLEVAAADETPRRIGESRLIVRVAFNRSDLATARFNLVPKRVHHLHAVLIAGVEDTEAFVPEFLHRQRRECSRLF